jgi:hypothetical protein
MQTKIIFNLRVILIILVVILAPVAIYFLSINDNTKAIILLILDATLLLILIIDHLSNDTGISRDFNVSWVIFLVLLAGLVMSGAIFTIPLFPDSPEVQFGIIIVLGSCLLLLLLFIVAIGFNMLKMADPNSALGLPEGSIRALIALLLILIFIMMSVFLYRETAGSVVRLPSLSNAQVNQLSKANLVSVVPNGAQIPTYGVVYQLQGGAGITQTGIITLTGVTLDQITNLPAGVKIIRQFPDGHAPVYDVYSRTEPSSTAADIAKQLVTTVGTLVVAVAGFYFGTRAVATARGEAGPAAPTIDYIDPPTGSNVNADPFQIKDLAGTGFAENAKVFLRQKGKEDIKAISVNVVSHSKITCSFLILNKEPGAWDVLVVNPDGSEGKLPGAFQITK